MIKITITDTEHETEKLSELPTDSLKNVLRVLKDIVNDVKEELKFRKNKN